MKPELIVALDVESEKQAKVLVDQLAPEVKFFKVGSILFTCCGHTIIKYICEKGGSVFLDLKWHDIPNTVEHTVSSGTASAIVINKDCSINNPESTEQQYANATDLSIFMMNVHTDGGEAMLKAAVRGAEKKAHELKIPKPYVVGVTVLTSQESDEAAILQRAQLAKDCGLDGVVCSVHEAKAVREACGDDFIIVTPGIRPVGYKSDDQKRVATVEDARKAGVDYIVVGRPIILAEHPREAAKQFQT